MDATELIFSQDMVRAAELASELNDENARRQAVEKELLAEAEVLLASGAYLTHKVLVLAGADWHQGVIGIVASRLVEKYYRPVVMISIRDGIGKGSCRSIPGFDMYGALEACKGLLIKFGGHHQAAGLSVAADNIELLRQRLGELANERLTEADYQPVLNIECQVALPEIDNSFLTELACLAPHEYGQSQPGFCL